MKKFLLYVFVVLSLVCCVPQSVRSVFAVSNPKATDTDFVAYFESLFGDNVSKKATKIDSVLVSGSAVGFALMGEGVVVVSVGSVESPAGKVCPCDGHDIKQGDVLLSIDDVRIESAKTIEEVVGNNKGEEEQPHEIVVLRDRKRFSVHVVPALDIRTNKKRLGLWIRDNTAGVGTLTYVTKSGRFGALGHPVCDNDTGTFMPIRAGELFLCNVVGICKGTRGKTGELKGVFVKSQKPLGSVSKNSEYGVFGEMDSKNFDNVNLTEMPVASRHDVVPGNATILSTISGMQPKEYKIEIVKTTSQSSQKSKSMVIRVTDPELLALTGGIVQGMSGSPIIQNGKFVGAVTHVFVSDPTKGFAVYAEWMLEE